MHRMLAPRARRREYIRRAGAPLSLALTVSRSLTAMKTIRFDGDGGDLFADVRSGFANPGSYTLILWAKDTNDRVMERSGNFINADDDVYRLEGDAAANDGRIVEAFITVSPPKGATEYFVSLRVVQDQQLLDEISFAGETDQPTITIDLFARLVRE